MVFQTHQTAANLNDGLGFVRLRPMVVICRRLQAKRSKRASQASGTAEVLWEA